MIQYLTSILRILEADFVMPNLNKLIRGTYVRMKNKPIEYWLYLFLLGILFLSYIIIGFFATRIFENGDAVRKVNFGFSQLEAWRFRNFILFTLVFLLILIFLRKLKTLVGIFFNWLEGKSLRIELFITLFAFVMIAIFLVFSTTFLNIDGRELQRKFERDIPTFGFHATHDEMWELYFHSRFWFYTHKYFGWDVRFSYRVASSIMGGIFVYVLLKYTRQRFGRNWFAFALLICSGGYMQLFFGDIENYTMTAVLIFLYLWSSDEYIQGKTSLIIPSLVLAIALTFHLLSGFFLPSLAYLYFLAIQRKQYLHVGLGFILSSLIIGLTLLFFANHGLPLRNLWTASHASGGGGNYSDSLALPSFGYYSQIINLLFLLVPAFIFLLPLFLFNRIKLTATNIHLLISTVGALILTFGWKAQLGVYKDWNLFAVTALPISLLVWSNFEKIDDVNLKSETALLAGFVFFTHSVTWIISNYWFKR